MYERVNNKQVDDDDDDDQEKCLSGRVIRSHIPGRRRMTPGSAADG